MHSHYIGPSACLVLLFAFIFFSSGCCGILCGDTAFFTQSYRCRLLFCNRSVESKYPSDFSLPTNSPCLSVSEQIVQLVAGLQSSLNLTLKPAALTPTADISFLISSLISTEIDSDCGNFQEPAIQLVSTTNESIAINITAFTAGRFQLAIGHAIPGGLIGSYFDNLEFKGEPMQKRIDETVDFQEYSFSAIASSGFSVRWCGFIRAPRSPRHSHYIEVYTFSISLSNSEDSAFLMIHDKILFNSSSLLDGSFALRPGTFYSLLLLYSSQFADTSSISLIWSSSSITPQVVPEENLFWVKPYFEAITVDILPGRDLNLSILSYSSLTIATAGLQSSYSIMIRDSYGNRIQRAFDHLQVLAVLKSMPPTSIIELADSLTFSRDPPLLQGVLLATQSGNFQLFVGYGSDGFLTTTFYDVPFENLSNITSVSLGWFDMDTGYVRETSNSSGILFFTASSTGFLKTTFPGSCSSFIIALSTSDSRVKLWIDNSVIIDQWSSLSSTCPSGSFFCSAGVEYLSIMLNYKSHSTFDSPKLSWESVQVSNSLIPRNALISPTFVQPLLISVLPDLPCPEETLLVGLSISTAGVLSTFNIFLRDRFGNPGRSSPEFCGLELFSSTFNQLQSIFRISVRFDDSSRNDRQESCTGDFGASSSGMGLLFVLMGGLHIRGSPSYIEVLPGMVSSISTTANGCALTLSTAGLSAAFSLSQRDKYGNSAASTLEGLEVDVRLRNSSDRIILRGLMSQNGVSIMYLITFAARYEIHVRQEKIHISGSPFKLNILSGSTCAVLSIAHGSGLTLSTSGLSVTFMISLKDDFENPREVTTLKNEVSIFRILNQSSFVVADGRLRSCTVRARGISSICDSMFATYTVTSAGTYALNIYVLRNGISATYYSNASFSPQSAIVSFNTIQVTNLSWPTQLGVLEPYLVPVSNQAVRWAGYLAFENTTPLLIMFFTKFSGLNERIKLWIENSLLVDQWTSLSNSMPNGTFFFSRGSGFYEIEIEYQNLMNTSLDYVMQLSWQVTGSYQNNSTPTISMLASNVIPSPSTIFAVVANACAATSYAKGTSLSLTTAGVLQPFTIVVRDQYGNSCGDGVSFLFATDINQQNEALSSAQPIVYKVTTSGNFSMFLKLITVGGLQSTFYADTSFQLPIYSGVSVGQNLLVAPILCKHFEYFSVRWSGFLQVTSSGVYTFYADAHDPIRISINSVTVVGSTSPGTPLYGVIPLSDMENNGMYRLLIELQHATGHVHEDFIVQWKTPGSDQRSIIPASNLKFPEHVCGSPFSVLVQAGPINASSSKIEQGTTIMTVGVIATFLVQLKDQFGNIAVNPRTLCFDLNYSHTATSMKWGPVAKLQPRFSNLRSLQLVASYAGSGQWDLLVYALTRAGTYRLQVMFPCNGGLRSHYTFLNVAVPGTLLSEDAKTVQSSSPFPGISRVDPGVMLNSSCSDVANLVGVQSIFVSWTGLINFPCQYCESNRSANYFFRIDLKSSSDRIKLWIENTVVIDQWESLDSLSPVGSFQIDSSRDLWSIDLWYSHVNCSEKVFVILLWNSSSLLTTGYIPISSSYLFVAPWIGENRDYDITVLPSITSAKYFYGSGPGLTIATAGQTTGFVFFPLDQFGNRISNSEILINRVHRNLTSQNSFSIASVIGPSRQIANSGYTYYSAKESGDYLLDVFSLLISSLQATYYMTENLTNPYSVSVERYSDTTFNFSMPFNTASARFAGMFNNSDNSFIISSVAITSTSDRVRLWIDGQILINQWASLSTLVFANLSVANSTAFPILEVDFKHSSRLAFPLVITMPSSKVFAVQTLANCCSYASAPLQVLPGNVCTAMSFAFGQSISLASVGVQALFAIQGRDEYSNLCTSNPDQYIIRVGSSYEAQKSLLGSNGRLYGVYMTPKAGPTSLHVDSAKIGGLVAEYFESSSFDGHPIAIVELDDSLVTDANDITVSLTRQYQAIRWTGYLEAGSLWAVGLQATYYDGSSFAPYNATKAIGLLGSDAIDFSSFPNTIPAGTSLQDSSGFSVRWSGFIRPSRFGFYTFYAQLFGSQDSVRVWVDNHLLINDTRNNSSSVTSLLTSNVSGAIFLKAALFYQIQIEYQHLQSNRSAGIILEWNFGYGIQLIGSEYLFPNNRTSQAVSLFFNLGGGSGARLWIGNDLIIDSWYSAANNTSDSVLLHEGSLYKIRVEYRVDGSQQKPKLSWSSDAAPLAILIPKSQLWSLTMSSGAIAGSPFLVHVDVGLIDPTMSTFSAKSLQFQVLVGQQYEVVICPIDAFQNQLYYIALLGSNISVMLKRSTSNFYSSYLNSNIRTSYRNINAAVSCQDQGQCISSIATTTAGLHSIFANFLIGGSLSRTYFTDATFEHIQDVPSNFTLSSQLFVQSYGFLKTPFNSIFTFFTLVSTVNERVRLWVDNFLVVDQWASLSFLEANGSIWLEREVYYELQLQYMGILDENVSCLSWTFNNSSKKPIPSIALYSAVQIGVPLLLGVSPDAPQVVIYKSNIVRKFILNVRFSGPCNVLWARFWPFYITSRISGTVYCFGERRIWQ